MLLGGSIMQGYGLSCCNKYSTVTRVSDRLAGNEVSILGQASVGLSIPPDSRLRALVVSGRVTLTKTSPHESNKVDYIRHHVNADMENLSQSTKRESFAGGLNDRYDDRSESGAENAIQLSQVLTVGDSEKGVVAQLIETIQSQYEELARKLPNDGLIQEIYKNTQTLRSSQYRDHIPDNMVLVGVAMQGCSGQSDEVNQHAAEYLVKLAGTSKALCNDKLIIPVPLESSHVDNVALYTQESKLKSLAGLKVQVSSDLIRLNGIVIPGDRFNVPAIKNDGDPYQNLMESDGKKRNGPIETVYTLDGKNLTEQNFNKAYPEHHLNPDPSIIHYETELLRQTSRTDLPVMCVCHGTQIFALMRGANMVAGIQGHQNEYLDVEIAAGSMTEGYLGQGQTDSTSLSLHTLALDPNKPGDGLQVVGLSKDGIVKIIEDEVERKPHYLYQTHPEACGSGIHPSIIAFAESTAHHKNKRLVQKEVIGFG